MQSLSVAWGVFSKKKGRISEGKLSLCREAWASPVIVYLIYTEGVDAGHGEGFCRAVVVKFTQSTASWSPGVNSELTLATPLFFH